MQNKKSMWPTGSLLNLTLYIFFKQSLFTAHVIEMLDFQTHQYTYCVIYLNYFQNVPVDLIFHLSSSKGLYKTVKCAHKSFEQC